MTIPGHCYTHFDLFFDQSFFDRLPAVCQTGQDCHWHLVVWLPMGFESKTYFWPEHLLQLEIYEDIGCQYNVPCFQCGKSGRSKLISWFSIDWKRCFNRNSACAGITYRSKWRRSWSVEKENAVVVSGVSSRVVLVRRLEKNIHFAGRMDRFVVPKFRRNGNCAKVSMENFHPPHWMPSQAGVPNFSKNQNILQAFF